jgi:hypothetical protein
MPRKRIAESTGSWMLFADAFSPELTESHVYLKSTHAKLRNFIEEVEQLGIERDFHSASKLKTLAPRRLHLEGSLSARWRCCQQGPSPPRP